ncbi:hypothetical protein DNU06_16700 [Putridiphycobacter roseus]|uniref:Uncharacterized protein n=2 Tax=Putridiphycobacter roseus TaxID=2219161 RepID=A0A2W1MWC5_9FLAO|nr:hypothetical protein DNU06_16700 [Putridiphycobacter roseus]
MISAKCTKTTIEPTPPKTPLEQLPAATQTGANTFGCIVDGEVYIPKGNFSYKAIEGPSYYQNEGLFIINTLNIKDFDDWIYVCIYIKNAVYYTGIYSNIGYTTSSFDDRVVEVFHEDSNAFVVYSVDSTVNHYVEITKLDLDNKIVSGLFEFTAITEDKTDTIKITNGRFDLNNLFVQ